MDKVLMDLSEANQISGIKVRVLRRHINRKKLTASKIGTKYFITPKALAAFIKDTEV